MPAKILARVFRGRTLESIHRGHYIVIDNRRKPIASAGDPGIITFMRSAAKPIQALHLVSEGTADAYGFSNEEIALACASHSGEPRHTRIAALMLDRVGLTEAHLHCGRHLPFNEKEAERMLGAGEYPTQLHNNCSGKHAAMLATAKHLGSDLNTYEKISHPLQQKIFQDLAEFAETSAEKIQVATDGCSAPNFAVSLSAMAVSFLNLVAPTASIREKNRTAASRIVSAMVVFPELVGGSERLDTLVMQAAGGKIVSKVGAEGVWLCAILPGGDFPGGAAIALKIEDGDDKRARPVVATSLLKKLGVLPSEALAELSPMPVLNRRGEIVGTVESAI